MFNPLKTLKALVKDACVREKIQEEKTQDESIKVLTGVQICSLESIQAGMMKLYKLQSSDETILIKAPAHTAGNLFVHQHQTDQLLVVRGSCVLVILSNRQYQYIPLSSKVLQVVTIPTGILHALINFATDWNSNNRLLFDVIEQTSESNLD